MITKPCDSCGVPVRDSDEPFAEAWLCYYCHCIKEGRDIKTALNGLAQALKDQKAGRSPQVPFAVVALFLREGHVLAVSRKGNTNDLGLPGGKIEFGETPEEALFREVKEETGLLVEGMLHVFTRTLENNQTVPCFLITRFSEAGSPLEEGAWVGWVRPQRLLEESCSFRTYNLNLFRHMGLA